MNNVYASIESGKTVTDGAGYQGTRFLTIWVGGGGDIALKNKDGSIYVITGVQGGAFFAAAGNFIGATADGTTATGLVVCGWGTYDVNS